jgi:pimeloyl-ACP methyl ester carboxylesterase
MKLSDVVRTARPAASAAAFLFAATVPAFAAVAVINQLLAKRSERRHPPRGRIIDVNGVDVHYFEAGSGPPVVLIHGNGVTAEDYVLSGLFHRLSENHRVIAFDRPGFGYSARPRSNIWTATAQADLIGSALDQLGVERPTVVAHSWGTLVALHLALRRPQQVNGLALLSGYYWPTPRLDVLLSGPAIPILGDVMRFTWSPLIGWLLAPLIYRHVFSPTKVPHRFKAEFAVSMSVRPSQIRASAGDTAMMPFEALGLSQRYDELACPVVLIAGDGDKLSSFKHQSLRLATTIGCELHVVEGAGHMIHHIAPEEVAIAVKGLIARGARALTVHPRVHRVTARADQQLCDVEY